MSGLDKRCCTCKQEKSIDSFAKSSSRPDGLQARCRSCVAEYYAQNKDKIKGKVAAYKSNNHEKVLQSQKNYRAKYPERVKRQKSKAYYKNYEHYRNKSREYYVNNYEKLVQMNKAWVTAHPIAIKRIKSKYKHKRRALEEVNGTYIVTDSDLSKKLYYAGNACVYCFTPFGENVKVTWDHIVPVTRGGTYSIGNLTPCCSSCNSSKQNKTVTEWKMWKIRNNIR